MVQFLGLDLQRRNLIPVTGGLRRWSGSSGRLLATPAARQHGRAAGLGSNRTHLRPVGGVFSSVFRRRNHSSCTELL